MAITPFQSVPIVECGEPLVDVARYGLLCEPRYFKQRLSKSSAIFVRQGVAEKLVRVESRLDGFRLLVWDGFRSREIQNGIYDDVWRSLQTKNPSWDKRRLLEEVGKFVTPAMDPARIPPHATGGAVDLTLANLDGVALDMGTDFDDFSIKSRTDSKEISTAAQSRRKILVYAMSEEEFVNYPDEWWHFGYGDQLSALLSGESTAIYGEYFVTEEMQL